MPFAHAANQANILTLSLSKGAMQIFVYMLHCADGSYYVGITKAGLDKRIGEHVSGAYRGYTFSRRPVALVWFTEFQSLRDAISWERRLKGWRRAKKEALIRGDVSALPGLARTAKRLPLRQAQGEGE